MTPLRAVTLDLWNTLIFSPADVEIMRAEARLAALTAALDALGWPTERERLLLAYERCGEQHAHVQWKGADITAEAHVGLLLAALAPERVAALTDAQHAMLVETYGRAALIAPPLPVAGLLTVLADLRARGLRIGLISNTSRTSGRILREVLRELGILDAFDTLVFSDEVGVAKPNPAIFALTLERLGVIAAAAVHVGDDVVLDYQGASRSGLRAILVSATRPPDLASTAKWISHLTELPQLLEALSLPAHEALPDV